MLLSNKLWQRFNLFLFITLEPKIMALEFRSFTINSLFSFCNIILPLILLTINIFLCLFVYFLSRRAAALWRLGFKPNWRLVRLSPLADAGLCEISERLNNFNTEYLKVVFLLLCRYFIEMDITLSCNFASDQTAAIQKPDK